ncbi:MAG TPA: HAD family phosphatase [Mycobacteriales bacterium]|jgi:putative hydrolase of the HAD superfamily
MHRDSAVTAVWTDFGGVLTPPVEETMARFAERIGALPYQLREAMQQVGRELGTDMMAPLDIPLLTEAQWSRRVERVLRERFGVDADLGDFGGHWFDDRPANQRWVDFLLALRRNGWFVGMLSNMVPSWEAHWRRMVPADALFDAVVSSYQVGCRKPDAAIYHLAAARAGTEPGRCVLVDDLEKNCAGARAAGWQAVHFRDTAQAAAELNLLLSAPATKAG